MKLFLFYFCFLGILVQILPQVARVQEIKSQVLVIDNPIAVARKFAANLQYEQATVILEALINAPGARQQSYYIEANMLLASVMVKQQNFDQAKTIYQNVLSVDPGQTAARLELAGIFRREDNHELALFHLELTDISNLPDQLKGRISNYMNWSRKREGWSFRTNFAVMPDTNINSATESNTVSIYGWEFDLSEDAQKTSGIGFQLGGGSAYIKAIGKRNFLDFKLDGQYTFYPSNSKFNQGFGAVRVGPRHQFDKNNEVSFYLRSYLQTFGGKTYSDGYGIETSFRTRLNIKQIIQISFSSMKNKNHFDENRNGNRYTGDITLRHYFTDRGYVNLQAGVSIDNVKIQALSSFGYNVGTGVYYQFKRGISIFINPQYRKINYKDLWGVFEKKRKDERISLSLDFTKRDLQILGFAPVLSFVVLKNKSNIDLFTYNRFRSQFSITRYY